MQRTGDGRTYSGRARAGVYHPGEVPTVLGLTDLTVATSDVQRASFGRTYGYLPTVWTSSDRFYSFCPFVLDSEQVSSRVVQGAEHVTTVVSWTVVVGRRRWSVVVVGRRLSVVVGRWMDVRRDCCRWYRGCTEGVQPLVYRGHS